MNRANKVLFGCNALVLGLVVLMAAAPRRPENLDVKTLTAERVVVRDAGSQGSSVEVIPAGVWVSGKGEHNFVSLNNVAPAGPALMVWRSDKRDGADFAVSLDGKGGVPSVQHRGQDGVLRHLMLDQSPQPTLAEPAGRPAGEAARPTRSVEDLATAYGDAIDSYRNREAREIAAELAPLLRCRGAVDRESALRMPGMRLGLWVESTPSGDEIRRG